ncbi:MAG: hypothetical protein Q7T11_03170, partial [Deltaproteobacteria bacterium]|nr:hypothetical protein [Deltaproteobacteria bacterium]
MKWKKKGLGLAWLAVMSLVSCGGLGLGSFGSDSSSDDPDDSTPSEGDEADATSGRMLISTSSAAVSSGSSALLLVPASEDDDSVTLAVPQSQTTTTVSAISVTASSLSRAPGAVVKNQTSGGISISSLDATTASPFASLTITGSGFDPEEAVVAVLFIPTGNGIPVAVPVNAGEADTLTVSVPPYMDATTGAYSSGAVGVQVVQIDGETVNTSNLKSGLTISELPTLASTVPTGV